MNQMLRKSGPEIESITHLLMSTTRTGIAATITLNHQCPLKSATGAEASSKARQNTEQDRHLEKQWACTIMIRSWSPIIKWSRKGRTRAGAVCRLRGQLRAGTSFSRMLCVSESVFSLTTESYSGACEYSKSRLQCLVSYKAFYLVYLSFSKTRSQWVLL